MRSTGLTVVITGASGLLGRQLVKKLGSVNYSVYAVGRRQCPEEIKTDCQWLSMDIAQPKFPNIDIDVLVHAAPLWLLPDFFQQLSAITEVRRCIAFSSTSAESKADANDFVDRELAEKLIIAEENIKSLCGELVPYTILRPTMIYGYGQDQNISVIASFIKKRGFFPVAGKAEGLRQPVHVDDLVDAVIKIIENENTFGKTYTLTGGETLSYKSMVDRIFQDLNRPSKIIHVPVLVYRWLLNFMQSDYSSGTADRMNQNLSYNSEDAVNDFDYQAQMFLTNPQRDLSGN